jgi:hypothetical protein
MNAMYAAIHGAVWPRCAAAVAVAAAVLVGGIIAVAAVGVPRHKKRENCSDCYQHVPFISTISHFNHGYSIIHKFKR